MNSVRHLHASDLDVVVARVVAQLGADASVNPMVNPAFDRQVFADALGASTSLTWVAERHDNVVGHLYGALLRSETYGDGVWVGPDGVSYDDPSVLDDLYAVAGQHWIDEGAREHYVWVLDDPASTDAWLQLGFARMHRRGVLELALGPQHQMPEGYRLRIGGADDLDVAVQLTTALDQAQERGPSFSLDLSTASQRAELEETLSDHESIYYVVEHGGLPVAQCITFPLPPRRGSFDSTLHLSAVVVRDEHRGRGVATALVDTALEDGRRGGFAFVETNWRVANRRADRFWTTYGFEPTYVRLHRTIGAG